MPESINRRKFIQTTALAGTGLAVPATQFTQTAETRKTAAPPPKSKINLGVIGVGLRGQSHVALALNRDDCNVVAINDVDEGMIERCKQIFKDKGKPLPRVYLDGDYGFRQLLEQKDIDAVLIASPWRWHSEQAIAAMRAGKYVGTEVCGAFSLDECWSLVHAHEETGSHLFFLENVCYRRDVMAVLNMVRQGLFGEMIHLECGYQHDLRAVKFNDGKNPYGGGVEFGDKGFSEAKWRTVHSVHRNADLYPTHGIGPVAQYTNINRGNRFLYLTSMASKSRGLHNYIINHEKGGPDHPNAKIEFRLGDKVTTLIKTTNGETIVVHHDTNLPRPYSLGFRVQGTKGLWMAVNKSLYLEGASPAHRWEEAAAWLEKYDHPLWKRHEQKAVGAGHGGMDFFLLNAFIESAKRNVAPPFDVYDAASWLAITPLSEASIAAGGQPMSFPDFTRGRWAFRTPTFAFGDEY
ncbi:MAG: gfo/Idh/MocA family oxidoreductase [Bacteroidetes bacterium]|nr:MAG: gfo/Idh/MocA family oxidoreductase [Bacteroidota bacterium]